MRGSPASARVLGARTPVTTETDPALVRRCLDGDRSAWGDLLGRYADLMYGLLRRSGLDEATAADAFQEISLLLWKQLKRLRDAERLLPFIATTTRRVAWRMKKRDRARAGRDREVARPEAAAEPSPDEQVASLEQEQAVRVALSSLGERCRRLLSALYFTSADGGYDEVAERLGIPRGSIGPTRRRCLEGLRKELLALGFAGDGGGPGDEVGCLGRRPIGGGEGEAPRRTSSVSDKPRAASPREDGAPKSLKGTPR